MAKSDVELMRSWYERAAAYEGIEWMRYWYDNVWAEDINWRAIEGAPDDVGEMHGRDRLVRYYADWFEMFDDLRATPEELIDAGEGRVIVVQHVTGRAKASGVPTELRLAVVYTIRDNRVASGREYISLDAALEALDLAGEELEVTHIEAGG
jgi:ketosteroid isomerase-like protein